MAQARGAPILGEVVGYALLGDAHHITAPSPTGCGAERAMAGAIADCSEAAAVATVNAHATSTRLGDSIELAAVRRLLQSRSSPTSPGAVITSNKGAIGHLLGAAGAVEAIFTVLSLRDRLAPPTLNYVHADPGEGNVAIYPSAMPLPTEEESGGEPLYGLCNSFGFGGVCASLLLKGP